MSRGSSSEPFVIRNLVTSPVARLILAHGAGAPMDSEFMTMFVEACSEHQIEVIRFEFPYMVERRDTGKKRPPNTKSVLLESWATMIDLWQHESLPVFIGGKSMGGRLATMWAAQNKADSIAGVVCLGYPFHPAGKPEKLRVEHLLDITVPVLIVQGTRDRMGCAEEVAGYDLDENIHLYWIETGDHDLKPLKRSGLSQLQAIALVAEAARAFFMENQKIQGTLTY